MPELPGGGKWAEVGEVTIVKPRGSVPPSASKGEWKHIHVAEAKAEGGKLKRIFEAEGGDLQENGIYVAPGAKVIYHQQTQGLMARKGSRKVIEDNINVAPGGRVVYDKQTLESIRPGARPAAG